MGAKYWNFFPGCFVRTIDSPITCYCYLADLPGDIRSAVEKQAYEVRTLRTLHLIPRDDHPKLSDETLLVPRSSVALAVIRSDDPQWEGLQARLATGLERAIEQGLVP
jgi:hypothetical protein